MCAAGEDGYLRGKLVLAAAELAVDFDKSF
jgi:hypothetical protein